jgi:high-affinity iron transporter
MIVASLIVFHEALEAALFVGIAAAATRGLPRRLHWLAGGVVAGLLGTVCLTLLLAPVRQALQAMGLVQFDMVLLAATLAMLLWHCLWTHAWTLTADGEASDLGQAVRSGQRAPWALAIAVAAAVLREGTETTLFLTALADAGPGQAQGSMLLHALLGLGLGMLAGGLAYAGLVRIPGRHLLVTTTALIAVFAASMAGQLAHDAFQAGWLSMPPGPVWDTTARFSTDSALGTVLHALVGYDGRPSLAQLTGFAGTLVFLTVVMQLMRAPQPATFPGSVVAVR